MFLYEQFEWDCVSSQSSSDYLTKEEECSVYTQYMIAQFIIIFLELYFLLVNSVVVGLALATRTKHTTVWLSTRIAEKREALPSPPLLFAPLIKASCALLLPVLALQEPSVLLFSHLSLYVCTYIFLFRARVHSSFFIYPDEKCFFFFLKKRTTTIIINFKKQG